LRSNARASGACCQPRSFKSIHVSRVNLGPREHSQHCLEGAVYPSPIRLEAVVFDLGAVWLDGRADFSPSLMWGWPRSGWDQVALDYFNNLAVRNGSLSLAGTVASTHRRSRG